MTEKFSNAKRAAEGIMGSEELGGRSKAKAIAKVYRQAEAGAKNKRKIVYAVHTNQSGKIMRAKGGSGGGGAIQVKHVDGNMKKERRALKRIAKKKGGKGASGARKKA